ncbi:hypothetical protein [Brevundimonas sp. NPDC046655]|uniref:hypothetical protein n=1 Tax=unclassified Brevundimonas TaxID=2622653 RepID=UPI00384ABFA1
MKLNPVVLQDRFVRLEPFTAALEGEVRAALDCDPEAWSGMVSAAYGERLAHRLRRAGDQRRGGGRHDQPL